MSTTKIWPGGETSATPTSYSIPAAGEKNWASLSNFLNALGDAAQCTTFQKFAIRKATASPVTVAVTDCVVACNLLVAGAVAVNLPAGANKQVFFVTDDAQSASTYNITITPDGSETIAGAATLVLNSDKEGVAIIYDEASTDWKLISRTNASGSTVGGFDPSIAIVSDGSGFLASSATTTTQIGYLAGATGTTGTTTTNVVFSTSPTLVTPVLGTPASGTLTNCDGLPISTGVAGLGANVATFLATPSSANLASALTDETGSGAAVFATSPTLVTPALGTPASGTLTNCDGLPISTGVSGLGSNVATFLATPSSANLASALTDETGSGAAVFGTSPTIATPDINAGTVDSLTSLSVRDKTAAFDLVLESDCDVPASADRTITFNTRNSDRTIRLGGNIHTEGAVQIGTTASGNSVTFQTTGVTDVTLPTTGTLATTATTVSTTLNEFNTGIGDSSNLRVATDTNLLGDIKASTQSSTVTITIAAPGVVTYASHGLSTGDKCYLTTTGALPTGLTASTTYYVVYVGASSFSLATTLANAVAGTSITTSVSQSGTHTLFGGGLKFADEDAKIPGKTSGNNTTAGYVGEVLRSSVVISAGSAAAGAFGNVTSLAVTPGQWLVYGNLKNTRVGGQTEITSAVSSYSANTTTDHVVGYNEMGAESPTISSGNCVISIGPWDQSILASTTYYLKAKIDGGTWTSGFFKGTLMAVRIS